jgi:hypothetical protein
MLCFPLATGEPRGSRETWVHHKANQARDFEIESGTASARRRSKAEGDEADESATPQTIGGWEKKNCSGTTGTLGENQGREEVA